jgi:hypothetical protein
MGGIKSGGLLLILAVPMGLYIAWQINGVVRTDLVLSDAPPDRGGTKEQLAALHTKTTAWAGEVQKAGAVTEQYRAAGPEDACTDADATALVKASAARAADLNDLDAFLSDLARPNFTGKLKTQYLQWMEERKELNRDAGAITTWLGKPPPITSAADANKVTDEILGLVSAYATRSKFSDKAKAAVWRVRARLIIVKALAALANKQYREAVQVKLPLETGNNAVKTAMATLLVLKAQLTALGADLRNADEEKAALDSTTRVEAESRGSHADECSAREELLTLFAKDDLFTNSTGAAVWLKQVTARYRRTKDEHTRALIRDKVQEFCDAFIPPVVRLPDTVLIKGAEAPREAVVVKFEVTVNGKVETKRVPLGGLDGINEFNLESKPPGPNTFVVYDMAEQFPRELKPTELSKAAVMFNAERKKIADGPTVPKWTVNSVEQLKKKCEDQKDLVDLLQTPDGPSAVKAPKIWTRLTGLATGMVGCADLFEAAP